MVMLMVNQAFNDGLVKICRVSNSSEKGHRPVEKLKEIIKLRYHERTIGMQRVLMASQNQIKVKYLIRCPLVRSVSEQDIAILNDGLQYRIRMIQYPENIFPRCMDLTLEEVLTSYELAEYNE